MKHLICIILPGIMFLNVPSLAVVDTLADSINIEDCIIYAYENCTPEESGEDCRRWNGGSVVNCGVGDAGPGSQTERVLMMFPGWDDVVPDSAKLKIYCSAESDAVDRKLFVYPITTQFYEGNENTYNTGALPDPDSGATWNHAYLDVGDGDSLNWTSAGGDYTTAIACTTTITGTGQYFAFNGFERILNYWDTSGNNYGIIIVNERAFPALSSLKVIKSSEAGPSYHPLLILFTTSSDVVSPRRRRILKSIINSN